MMLYFSDAVDTNNVVRIKISVPSHLENRIL